jgi:hypothetical protein
MLGNIMFTIRITKFLVLLLSLYEPFLNFENKYSKKCRNLPYLFLESDRKCPQLAACQLSTPYITINLTSALKHKIQKCLTVTTHNHQLTIPILHLYTLRLVTDSYCIHTCSRDFSLACLHAARFSALSARCSAGDNSFSSSSSDNSPCVKNLTQDFTACTRFEQKVLWTSSLFCTYTNHLTNLLLH